MSNFWDYSVWGSINLVAVLLTGLLAANALKRKVYWLRVSLIPTSVLGGILVLLLSTLYGTITGTSLLSTAFFNCRGIETAEVLTYHCLALGFIATVFKPGTGRRNKQRNLEIFNTGVTTVATYLLQAVLGMGITILFALLVNGFFSAAGILLPFGFGQGTGQALNYGSIYEADYGFTGGKSFGLTIAAVGFLTASIGGVIHLNLLSRKGLIVRDHEGEAKAEQLSTGDVQGPNEIPMNGSIDKLTVQLGLVFGTYMLTYLLIYALGNAISAFKSVLYGFNFLFGVMIGTLINYLLGLGRAAKMIRREYVNPFLMKRISGFFFDLMIVAGIAAIRIEILRDNWLVLAVLCIVGAFATYFYNRFVARTLFTDYAEEQFLAMFGMLTGTASTGIILLREKDPDFKTPVADNLVYQNFPAIVFGFPMMLLAAMAPKKPLVTFCILIALLVVMNIILFRKQLFGKKK